MKYFILCTVIVSLSGKLAAQSNNNSTLHSETNEPKKFLSPYYAKYDLIGKVNKTIWTVWNYNETGNTDSYYYQGCIENINLGFANKGQPKNARLMRKSIKAYRQPKDNDMKNVVYEKASVLLDSAKSVDEITISHVEYSLFIDSTGKLKMKDDSFDYYYNSHGDMKDMIYHDSQRPWIIATFPF